MGEPRRDRLPVVEPESLSESDRPTRPAPRVAGVLLAAGTSSRYGDANKLLADVDGEPMVRQSAQVLVDAGLDPVIVVVGYDAESVRAALDGLPVDVVENEAFESGQASTLRRGVQALESVASPESVDAAVFSLGDMPYVDPASVEALVATYAAGSRSALAAGYQGHRGNPVLFDRRHFSDLVSVDGDRGGREILYRASDAAVVETGDPGVRRDVDRPDDIDPSDDVEGGSRRT
jgi:molybdenum cofactor cytidylyltransferase